MRIGLVIILFLVYGLGYHYFYPAYGTTLGSFFFGSFLAIPILLAAWLLGLRAGIIAWAASIPFIIILLLWCGASPLVELFQKGGIFEHGLLLLMVIPAGKFHDLRRQMAREPTRQHPAEDDFYESRHFVREVMGYIPDVVYIHDLEKASTVYINHAITSMLGYTPEAVRAMGSTVDEMILHPDDVARTVQDVRSKLVAAKDSEVVPSEYRV
ncbi:MAG: PAS domain-containing protein, partial [Anaerolineae bacterium]|nr:PAS domain-containing protein [Anaerolineae bacterium]